MRSQIGRLTRQAPASGGRQALAAFGSATADHRATGPRAHARAEAVDLATTTAIRLISALHGVSKRLSPRAIP